MQHAHGNLCLSGINSHGKCKSSYFGLFIIQKYKEQRTVKREGINYSVPLVCFLIYNLSPLDIPA